MDAFGGHDAMSHKTDKRKVSKAVRQDGLKTPKFTYVWDQAHYNPITGDAVNHIHFRFPDGSKLRKAFTYEWRLWSLPELQDLLIEAGFSDVSVYWEGSDEEGEGNGVWSISREGEACEGWIAYLVAAK